MNDHATTIQDIKEKIKKFVEVRDWGQFHDAKNLSMGIATEAAELMEHFRFIDGKASSQAMESNKKIEIEHEIADITFMILSLCNRYNIDLTTAIMRKMVINEQRYPVEKAKGRADKYTEL